MTSKWIDEKAQLEHLILVNVLNCDSQLDTYKSKNKCGERSYYRYHKNEINNNKN